MKIDKVIDAEKVADLARRIKMAEEEVVALTNDKAKADQLLNGAQVALSNLRIALSREVDNHLDVDELTQPRRVRSEAK